MQRAVDIKTGNISKLFPDNVCSVSSFIFDFSI